MGNLVGRQLAVERRKWPDRPHYRFNDATVLGEDEHGTWLAVPPQPAYLGTEVAFVAQTWAALLIPHNDCWWAAFLLGTGAFDIYVDIGTTPQWEEDRVWMFDLDLDVVRWADRGPEIVDREEFEANAEAYAYPASLMSDATAAADRVFVAMLRGDGPFGSAAAQWTERVSQLADATWLHGSPLRLELLRAGSTITRDPNIARVFSHKPSLVARDDFKRLTHNGTEPGYLYQVVDVSENDVYPHPTSTMDDGIEWLTTRELRLTLLGQTSPIPLEVLTDNAERALRGRLAARSSVEPTDD